MRQGWDSAEVEPFYLRDPETARMRAQAYDAVRRAGRAEVNRGELELTTLDEALPDVLARLDAAVGSAR